LHPIGKILIGAVLVVGGIWWILQGSITYTGRSGLSDFLTVVNGIIPPLVALIGVFIIWLELDELRIERELAAEERKVRRKK
jgi:hypothetical protein